MFRLSNSGISVPISDETRGISFDLVLGRSSLGKYIILTLIIRSELHESLRFGLNSYGGDNKVAKLFIPTRPIKFSDSRRFSTVREINNFRVSARRGNGCR